MGSLAGERMFSGHAPGVQFRIAFGPLLALLLAGCAGATPTPQVITITAPPAVTATVTETLPPIPTPAAVTPAPTFTITGTLTMGEDDVQVTYQASGASCVGKGGYDDIRPGAQVVVTNESGQVIGRSSLGDGAAGQACVFSFNVADVPIAQFYAVEISHRGAITFSRADLEAQGWAVAITLG